MKKVIIITGANSGIGLKTAIYLSKLDYIVYGTGRKDFIINDFNYIKADVNDEKKMNEVFKEIYLKEKRIDALINNAGIGIAGAIEDTSSANIENICNTNLIAIFKLSKLIIPYLKESKGHLINISSVGGIIPLPYQSIYSATKAAVDVFSRALANELKPFKVHVCSILPGDTKTNFTSARVIDDNKNENTNSMKKSVDKMAKDEQNGMDAIKVSKVIHKVLKSKKNILRVSIGFSSKLIVFLSRIFPLRFINYIVYKIYC